MGDYRVESREHRYKDLDFGHLCSILYYLNSTLGNLKQKSHNPLVSQKIISTFAGYFRVQAFGPIQKEMISETQFLYRRGSAKGDHFFIYEAFQL